MGLELRNYSFVTEDNIEKTYKKPSYAPNCIKYLKSKGLVPLYINDNFPYVNVLAGFAFYTGCLTKSKVNISEDEETLNLIEKNITNKLDLKTKIIPRWNEYGTTLTNAKRGAYISRFLETMGLPRQSGLKSRLKSLEIPRYRKEMFEFVSNDLLSKGDYETVKKLEHDLSAILFSTRSVFHSKNNWTLHFFARPTTGDAESFAKENLKLINFSSHEIEIPEERIQTRRLKSGSYSSQIMINRMYLECILDSNRDLLKFSPKLQKLYGFELDFEPVEIF
jgi:hypothetical protein